MLHTFYLASVIMAK